MQVWGSSLPVLVTEVLTRSSEGAQGEVTDISPFVFVWCVNEDCYRLLSAWVAVDGDGL